MIRICIFILLYILSTTYICARELSKSEYKTLNSKGFVVESRVISGAPWPEVIIYALINSKVIDSVAIFSAYDDQKLFVPDLVKSIPVKKINSRDIHVSFEMDMAWPLSNALYTTGNKLKVKKDGKYSVEWYLVSSDSSDDIRGEALFIPYKNITLLKYTSFIKPKSIFASLLEGTMLGSIKNAVQATVDHIEKINKIKPKLSKYRESFLQVLNGKDIYNLK